MDVSKIIDPPKQLSAVAQHNRRIAGLLGFQNFNITLGNDEHINSVELGGALGKKPDRYDLHKPAIGGEDTAKLAQSITLETCTKERLDNG
ncbi:MAG: hypothetical protein AB4040_04470 [Synechococcus sp.]